MQELIEKILKEYPISRKSEWWGGQDNKMRIAFNSLTNQIENLDIVKNNSNLIVDYSIGSGNWAQTPWLAIMDKRITTSAQKGLYIVFLFDEKGILLLEFAQGIASVQKEFKKKAAEVLQQRSEAIRKLLPDAKGFEKLNDIETTTSSYKKDIGTASRIVGKKYEIGKIPNDEVLTKDIKILLEFLETYFTKSPQMEQKNSTEKDYSYDDALKDLFLSKKDLMNFIETAKRKNNIILQGPPGVGKTFVSKRLGYLLMGEIDKSRIEFVQFHQSYSYEDFVQGWRPSPPSGFVLRDGVFYKFCQKAKKDLKKKYIFIIDEINRGNLSKIFGELLMLIEDDKRENDPEENGIKLAYSENDEDKFSVPENIYIIGLMNTADRSLSLVDYALRRRFAFFKLKPEFESENFAKEIKNKFGTEKIVKKIIERIGNLNRKISSETRDLGPGFEIGHSYFTPKDDVQENEDEWYRNIIDTEIKPLIDEYWSDNLEIAEEEYKKLIS
jgi:MoxR-like ATPase